MVALIAAGYFFDVIDLIVLGSLIPDMIQSKFATGAEAGLVGSATVFGMFIGAAGQGEFSDRWGRKTVYQFNLLLFGVFTILGALAPTVFWLMVCRFIAGLGLGAEQPLAFAYAGEYSPKAHPRPHPGDRALHRRRLRVADRFPVHAAVPRFDRLARRLDRHRHRRADRLAVPLLRCRSRRAIWRPMAAARKRSTCSPAWGSRDRRSSSQPDAASDTKSDPFGVVFKMFPRRVIAGMICFSAFFGVAIGLGDLAAQHHDREGLHHHQVAHLHLRHDVGGAVREPVHDVCAR